MATGVPVRILNEFGVAYWTGLHCTQQVITVLSKNYDGDVLQTLEGSAFICDVLPDTALVTVTRGAMISEGIFYGTVDYPATEAFRGIGVHNGFHGVYEFLPDYFDKYYCNYTQNIIAPEISSLSVTRVGKVFSFNLTAIAYTDSVVKEVPSTADLEFRGDFGGNVISQAGTFQGIGGLGNYGEYAATIEHDFTTAATVRFEVVDAYGQHSRWLALSLAPVASFTYDDYEYPVVALDASDSFDPDGSIVSWAWYFGGELDAATGETTSVDVEGSEAEVNLYVGLTVTDNDGLTASTSQAITLQGIPRFDALTDVAGVRYGAVNSVYDNPDAGYFNAPAVQVYFFGETVASREDRATVLSLRHPSIWKDETDLFWMLGQRGYGSSSVWHCGWSTDGGRRFIVANQVWGSDYFNAHAGPTPGLSAGGGVVSVAVKKRTDPAELYFKRSENGGSWPNDAAAVFIGTLPVGGRAGRVYQEPGTGDLLITNGIDRMWRSTDSGRIWEQL